MGTACQNVTACLAKLARMLTADEYLDLVAQRIQRSGGQLRRAPMGQVNAVVGLFAENAVMSMMNYAIVAAPAAPTPRVTGLALHQFSGQAMQVARANMVGVMGLTATSVTIAGLVGTQVTPDGIQVALAKPANQFGAETRLVAVDLTAGAVHTFTGTRVWGYAVQGAINAKIAFCFPPLAEAWEEAQQLKRQRGPQGPPTPQPPPTGAGQTPRPAPPRPPQASLSDRARPERRPVPVSPAPNPTPAPLPEPDPADDRTQVLRGGTTSNSRADATQVVSHADADADATQVVSHPDADVTRVVPRGQTS